MLDAARDYLKKGWAPIDLPHKSKAPVIEEWQKLRLEEAELEGHFGGAPKNIGVLLGEPSGDLIDVDLDATEAVRVADRFLPKTAAVFGRRSKPRSHRLYICSIKTETFSDVTKQDDEKQNDEKSMLVEIRSTGRQTVFPRSTHPLGELVEWVEDGEPARVDAAELRLMVVHLAGAALLAHHWPGRGARHDAALAAAGLLVRLGVEEARVVEIVAGAARAAWQVVSRCDVIGFAASLQECGNV